MEKFRKLLFDIDSAISLIDRFMKDVETFDQYVLDLKTQSAVERQLVIIGEALVKIRKLEGIVPIRNDYQIIAFRNRLVHAYDSIDNAIVWVILKKHLPELKNEINNVLDQK
jgi:uncharacterized protein with HEPN domain